MLWRRAARHGRRRPGPASSLYRLDCETFEGRRVPSGEVTSVASPLTIVARLGNDSDANGIVVRPRVVIEGQTAPGAVVRLDRETDGDFGRTTRADRKGHFQFRVLVDPGLTPFHAVARDRHGRRAESDVLVARGDTVLDWNATLLEAIRVDRTVPPVAARALAMVHVAMYDAVNAIDRQHEPYAVDVRAPRGTSAEAAAAQAAYRVATTLFPDQTPLFEAALKETLAAVRTGSSRAAGVRLGNRVGRTIMDLRVDDGASAEFVYVPGTDPGDWVPTPTGFMSPLLPQWPYVRPFGIVSGSQFRPPDPPALDTAEYATEVGQVKELGSARSARRTADQTAIALFWADGPGTFTPPGHWNQIAGDILLKKPTDLATGARLFALLNVAEADAAIASWDAKYAYDRWRPVTAIRQAGTDGNAATEADPSWTTLIPTPPFPAYTSGHSTFSGAAAEILASFFGADYAFETLGEPSLGLPPRQFASFRAAAEEAGWSRIYGGIHFASDNLQGLDAGRAVARYVLEHVAR